MTKTYANMLLEIKGVKHHNNRNELTKTIGMKSLERYENTEMIEMKLLKQ